MPTKPKYYIVESSALPEVFLKVAEAKRLLSTGEASTVNEATRITAINSIVPTNGTAVVTISAETIDLTMTLEELMNRLSAIQGVLKADVLAG